MTMTPFDRLPLRDEETGDLTVVVETPRGSRNKYRYDSAHGVLRLGSVLAEGLSFPVDFGFFPSTLGEDGDPLDVLLLLDNPAPPGCAIAARLIGVLEVEQKETKGRERWSRNDRFVAVATQARLHQEITRLAQLRPHLVEEIEAFLIHYTGMNGKILRILRRSAPPRARQLLKAGERAAHKAVGKI
jgi:inorganic pyrophosphatase